MHSRFGQRFLVKGASKPMWFTLYSVLAHSAFVIGFPWLAWNAWRTGKIRGGLGDRFGRLDGEWIREVSQSRPIWIHAVSVGEAQMLPPILERLSKYQPDIPIVVSTNTMTGQAVAKAQSQVAGTFFVPLDFGWAVRGILERLRPRLLIILETEIWPNLILQSSRDGVPVVFLNGRISDRSFERYLRLKPFVSQVLTLPSAFGMRSEADASRIIRMGAPANKVRVLGNLKYESAYQLVEVGAKLTRSDLGLKPENLLIVGGSTFPGEEEMLIRIYGQLRGQFPMLRLLLAPRHPQRFSDAALGIERAGHQVWRRSMSAHEPISEESPPILLLDVMGELKFIYALADIVFIGKSMGLTQAGRGGQNPLEPAAWSKPILFGPYMQNFEEVAQVLVSAGGAEKEDSEEDLVRGIKELLEDPNHASQMGHAAFSVIESSLGAADRGIELIGEVLGSPFRKEKGG